MKVNIYDFHFNKILNYNFFFSKFCETYILLPDTIEIINHTYYFVEGCLVQCTCPNLPKFCRKSFDEITLHDKGI